MHIKLPAEVSVLAGSPNIRVRPFQPFDILVCEFISDLSKILMATSRDFPDVISLGFWSRRANIDKLYENYKNLESTLGRGFVFHVAPSNVPVNFAFSFLFGLLAGNSNVVRVPSLEFPQIDIICRAIKSLFEISKYEVLRDSNALVRYDKKSDVSLELSRICQARVIWGGTETIRQFESFSTDDRTVDVIFADRYSFSVIDALSVETLSHQSLMALAEQFYNDTYLMDQNACSSPHLIVWQHGENASNVKSRFWSAVSEVVRARGGIPTVHVITKYLMMCKSLASEDLFLSAHMENEYVYRISLKELPKSVDHLRGQFGLFYEYDVDSVFTNHSILEAVNSKYQTLTYFGVDRVELLQMVIKNNLLGIDRIVPIGQALDIGVIWDGYDVVRTLSRPIVLK